jgi:7,8-dihydropterin-6-yl-methyl-4-(beta-D-ribofuranosyl)aminobenzene 5'-phosphate synthase
MNFKITTLSENTVPQAGMNLIGEHGLSFYIETEKNRILFDVGQGLAIANNAKVLGIDLSAIETVALSHGHYDHAGGLKRLLECNTNFTLHAHPSVFDKKLKRAGNNYKFIGSPLAKDVLEQNGINLMLEKKPVQISPGIMTTGEIPMENDFEETGSGFYIESGGEILADFLADDQGIILDAEKGSVVLLGCSHRGVINTLNHVVKLTSGRTIHAILGGFHLGNASESKLRTIMDHLSGFGLEKIGVGHCTGSTAFVALCDRFPQKVFPITVGNVIDF